MILSQVWLQGVPNLILFSRISKFICFNVPVKLVEDVVKAGINYIDTAPWYGQGRSETVLGKAFK